MRDPDAARERVVLAVTEVWRRTGGIPAFNRLLIDAACDAGFKPAVVSLNDRAEDRPKGGRGCDPLVLCGCSRRSFLGAVARAIPLRRRSVLVLGHVSLAPLGLILSLLLPRLRYVVVVFGVEAWDTAGWLTRASLRRAHRVAVISEFTADRVVEANGVPRHRLFLLRPVLSDEMVQRLTEPVLAIGRRSPADDAAPGPVLLTTGRIESGERYKGHDRVIRALPQVLERHAGARYTIVGEGSDRDRLEILARDVGVSASVNFTGFVQPDELDRYYQACDLFVMPSTGEGFGIVFLEAMLHGKAVIAGNRDGSGEPVEHGRTGWLVDPEDIDQVAAAILDLLDNPERRACFGAAGRQRVLEHFTAPRFRRDLHRLVAELAA